MGDLDTGGWDERQREIKTSVFAERFWPGWNTKKSGDSPTLAGTRTKDS